MEVGCLSRGMFVKTKVFNKFRYTKDDEYQRPVAPKYAKNIKIRQIVEQKQNPNGDKNEWAYDGP